MKLVWTESAVADLEAIRDYLRRDSEHYAARFVARLLEAVQTLTELPGRGRPVPEAGDSTVRELLFQNYRIMYKAEAERVVVLAVIHAARDIGRADTKPWEVT